MPSRNRSPACEYPPDALSTNRASEPPWKEGQGHRVRQPEGRRGQDDDDAEPGRRVRGGGSPGAVRRHGPAGQPDDVPGHRPGHAREIDVRRARPQGLDPRGDPQARDRRRLRLDRPRRRGDRDVDDDRPRARAAEGVRTDPRGLRLHLHRHSAEPRAAHDQRAHGGRQGDRPRAVRVSVDARSHPAAEHARDDPREPQSGRRHRGYPARRWSTRARSTPRRRSRSSRKTSATACSRRVSARRFASPRRP